LLCAPDHDRRCQLYPVNVARPRTGSAAPGTTLTVVEAVVPSSAVAEIENSPGTSKQQEIRKVALARPEASVVDVIVAARKVTTMFGGNLSAVQVVSTLAYLAGIALTSHVSAGADGASPSVPIAEAATMSAARTTATKTDRMANLRT
jgi:hypothetical protein